MSNQTQIVILAAGIGSRLGRSLPKPLTELADGRTIMRQQLDNITQAFNKVDTTIVVGYKLEEIIERYPDCNFVYNANYDQTNTSKSLLLALEASKKNQGVLWMNGDVVFDPEILEQAKEYISTKRSFVTVNTSSVDEEEVKYTVDAEGFINTLSKTVSVVDALGEAVGINYVAPQHKSDLIRHLRMVNNQDYFEKGIENAIQQSGMQVEPMDISETERYAVEVDFAADLIKANSVLNIISDMD